MTVEGADISVIVPVLNGVAFIATCLDSLLRQETPPREIIVADNGSTDGTLEIVKEYEMVTLVHEAALGAGCARNRGAGIAQGRVLAFLDVDCVAETDWLKHAWRILASEAETDGFVGFSRGINRNIYAAFFQRSYDKFMGEIQSGNGRLRKIDTKNFFLRRRVFEAIGGFDPALRMSEDVDLGIRLHGAGYRVTYAPSVVVSHVNPTRLSSRVRVRREQGFFDYMVFQKNPLGEALEYFPSFGRPYSRYVFLKNPPPSREVLFMITLIADAGIWVTWSLLVILSLFGLGRHLYVLDRLLMDFTIFQGKVYAKRVSAGYTTLNDVISRGRIGGRRVRK